MAELGPYVPKKDGDLIEAEGWNEIQVRTRADIGRHTHTNQSLGEGEDGWFDGIPIPTEGLAPLAVTDAKIADDTITEAKFDLTIRDKLAGAFTGPLTVEGNVGIGTTSPGARLTVQTPNAYDGHTVRFESKNDPARYFLNLNTSVTSPGAKLDVSGYIKVRGSRTYLQGLDGDDWHWIMVGGDQEGIHNALGFRIADGKRYFAAGSGWTKTFLIHHPLDPEHKYLIHATVEGPEAAVFYRGEAQLSNGQATVLLPDYFEALTREENRTVLLTPKFEGDAPISMLAAAEVKDGKLTVKAIDGKNLSQKFYWEVKAVRADVEILAVEEAKTPTE